MAERSDSEVTVRLDYSPAIAEERQQNAQYLDRSILIEEASTRQLSWEGLLRRANLSDNRLQAAKNVSHVHASCLDTGTQHAQEHLLEMNEVIRNSRSLHTKMDENATKARNALDWTLRAVKE
jgi:hypothetical protein